MDNQALLRKVKRHAPVLKFAADERFFPMAAGPYVERCSLHTWVGGDDHLMRVPPGHLTLDDLTRWLSNVHFLVYADVDQYVDSDDSARFEAQAIEDVFQEGAAALRKLGSQITRGKLPQSVLDRAVANYGGVEQNPPTYFYRILKRGDTGAGFDFIQYWLFYAYNDWASSHDGVNDHEADWELVQLAFDNLDSDAPPVSVAYSAHNGNYTRAWNEVAAQSEGLHPVVYVGGGSHANFPDPAVGTLGRLMARIFRNPLKTPAHISDLLHTGAECWRPGNTIIGSPAGVAWAEPIDLDSQAWVRAYRGQWGARYFIEAPPKRQPRRRLGGAPAGPMFHVNGFVREAWSDPARWHGL